MVCSRPHSQRQRRRTLSMCTTSLPLIPPISEVDVVHPPLRKAVSGERRAIISHCLLRFPGGMRLGHSAIQQTGILSDLLPLSFVAGVAGLLSPELWKLAEALRPEQQTGSGWRDCLCKQYQNLAGFPPMLCLIMSWSFPFWWIYQILALYLVF